MTSTIYTNIKTTKRKTTKEFIEDARLVHGDKYIYSLVNYTNNKTKVEIVCPIHGSFFQRPNDHLHHKGCPKCAPQGRPQNTSNTKGQFIKDSINKHGNRYDYSQVKYINSHKKVEIVCPEHGSFLQLPYSHLQNGGCRKCSKRRYSKIAIRWLESINPEIQHALNGGEYYIPSTRYSVDGYYKETNTVYEFHGDKFHGNPELFNPDDTPHPFNKTITAKELYEKTIKRENEIKDLGYNLVVMWESDYKKIN